MSFQLLLRYRALHSMYCCKLAVSTVRRVYSDYHIS